VPKNVFANQFYCLHICSIVKHLNIYGMKKFTKNLILVLMLGININLQAQIVESSSCTSMGIDLSKTTIIGEMPKQNGMTTSLNAPCSTLSNNVEENPAWWHFRALSNSAKFTITATNCIAGTCGSMDIEMALWEGESCSNIQAIACISGANSMTLTAEVSPCKLYFLQVDGVCESQCNIVITYNNAELLGEKLLQSKVEGENKICKGFSQKYAAKVANAPNCSSSDYKWTLIPANAGTVSPVTNAPGEINLNISNPPANKKVKLCAVPVFKTIDRPNFKQDTLEIEVIEVSTTNCKNVASKDELSIDNQINVYPNPTDNKFIVELASTKNAILALYNIQGQLVLSQKSMTQLADNQYEANVTHLPKGVYFLKINLDENVGVRKIVVE
jgi:Secretion system C-terminal sorting domain